MNAATEVLESFLKIYKGWGYDGDINEIMMKNRIENWNKALIGNDINEDNDMFNQGVSFIILFRIGKEDELRSKIATSKPIIFDNCDNPEVGVITLNPNINYDEMTLEYLKIIMLHEFTHLIAFNDQILESVNMNII